MRPNQARVSPKTKPKTQPKPTVTQPADVRREIDNSTQHQPGFVSKGPPSKHMLLPVSAVLHYMEGAGERSTITAGTDWTHTDNST